MLRQRVITALVLLAVLLPALFYPSPLPFSVLALGFMAAAAWEWARLNGCGAAGALAWGAAFAALCAGTWLTLGVDAVPSVSWWLAGAVWVLGGAWVLRRGVGGWAQWPRAARLVLGVVMLGWAWLAVAQARALGINFLLSVLVLVWTADIGAYFAGRAFGGRLVPRKLAPTISPGKSWEGVFGGMAGVLLVGALWLWADRAWVAQTPSLYTRLWQSGGLAWVAGLVFLAAMSVVGDLVESLVKRSAGAKDSSALLPGHGGVLDRVDALLPTLPLALMWVGGRSG
ncbi:MAG: phosphatidate cytidylyltransferase [Tibeticola sp.]